MGKHYAPQYIARAVRICEGTDRPLAQIARELGVQYGTLHHWMTKAGKTKRRVGAASSGSASRPQTVEAMQAEIERLQRELAETQEKLEFAKKAAAFFAQQNK